MLTEHPDIYRACVDKDERPRRYHGQFFEHERALAWQRLVMREHDERFGFRQGCSRTGIARNE